MAALESWQFVPFTLPLSTPPFYNRNSPCPSDASCASRSLDASGRQEICSPAAIFSRPECQIEAGRNTVARAEGREHALADNDDESDVDFPSPEELSRAVLRPKISTEASKTGYTAPRLEQPARNGAGLQASRAQSGSVERQGSSRDDPMILDDDSDDGSDEVSAEDGAEGDVDPGRLEGDASPHTTFAISEFASRSTELIDASGPQYDVEEGWYVEEPAPEPGSLEQHGVPSTPAHAQPQTLPHPSQPLPQIQTNQQGVGSITWSTSVEPAFHFLPKPSDRGDDGWTDESVAELETELGVALGEQQVESPRAGAPTSPSLRSVEAPQDEIQNRERADTTGGRPDELQDACRHGAPAQGLEEWEQREAEEVVVVVDGGGVVMRRQEELATPTGQLGQATAGVGHQQDLVEVGGAGDPGDQEVTKALPAAQPKIPEIDEHRFRLRGVRVRQLAGRRTKTTQYRLVWGGHPNRSDSWFNEDEVQISMPCEPYSQDPALQVDIFRVCRMRSSLRKGRKVFEYLVDMFGLDSRTWTTEDQLGISLDPGLVAELKASSPHPLSEAQRDVLLRHSATPISDEHRHAPRTPRGSSAPADPALGAEPATRKRGHQDMRTENSSETHDSVNTDDNHDTRHTNDEDTRPAKRRKPRSAAAVTLPPHLGSPSTTRPGIDEAQPHNDHGCSSAFINEQHRASQSSRSPSAAAEAVPLAEYQEWPFQGFLKRIRIGDDVTYNLEFKLPSISGHLHPPIDPAALDNNHDAAARCKVHQALLKPKRSKVPWTEEEDATLFQMWDEGRSWEEISDALPGRSEGTIRVRCSTKFKKRSRVRADRS